MSEKDGGPKLTPWYPALINPVRKGVYDVSIATPWYRYWDGANWHWGASTPDEAFRNKRHPVIDRAQWRGLTERAK